MSEQSVGRAELRRSDAKANRVAIINAAAVCFEEDGFSVPMEKIIARAGVGRGTLYRNFEGRTELLLAIFERELDRVDDTLAPDLSLKETIATTSVTGRRMNLLFQRVAAEMLMDATLHPALAALGLRYDRLLTPALKRSQAAGEVAQEIDVQQAVLVARMVASTILPHHTEEEARSVVEDALDLIFNGLRPAS